VKTTRSLVLAIALFVALATSPAFAATSPTGIWQGTLTGLRLVLHVNRDSTGRFAGTLDSPNQGSMDMSIDTITITGDSLNFDMTRPHASYRGRLSADGGTVSGVWLQSGLTLPLELKHFDQAPVERRPQDPKPPFPYRSEDVKFPSVDGITLAGTVTAPNGAGPFPAVVLISGSGPEDRNEELFGHKPFLVLADHLTRHGIAVLRVDDRGVGGSTGDKHGTSDDFANDALAGVKLLLGRADIDKKRIGLIGHSEGGMIAPIAASRSKDIAFMVFLAGVGVPGDSLLLLQNKALLRQAGVSDEAAAPQVNAMRRTLALVKQNADSAAIFHATRDMVEAQIASLGPVQRASLGSPDSIAIPAAGLYRSSWMRFFVGYDPGPVLGKYKGPLLALNGSRDVQVPPKENLASIEQILKRAGNRDVTTRELPGLNHLFQHCTTCTVAEYGKLEETMAPEALDAVSDWITGHTTAKR
jgi:hypothetical protein